MVRDIAPAAFLAFFCTLPIRASAMQASHYLLLYNAACFLGWSLCLAYTIAHWTQGSKPGELFEMLDLPLFLTQTVAILEVVHAALGFVRSPVATTAQQVASRLFLVWGILFTVPEVASSSLPVASIGPVTLQLDLYTLMAAWGVTEIIRYSFYAAKELDAVPYVLVWLRYTTFIVLYPLGVASELAMVWMALPIIREKQRFRFPMPNAANMSFDYAAFCVCVMLCYVPGFPPLYLYMWKQRAKTLGRDKAKSA